MDITYISNNIFTIDGFFTADECRQYIGKSEAIGYEAATVETEKGAVVMEAVRNNNRVIHTNEVLAKTLWPRLQPFAPAKIGNSIAIGLNEMFRFYKYKPGQQFKKHVDQSFIRNDVEASYYTFMVYLNDECTGGETSFGDIATSPKQGTALVFLHGLEHEGSEVKTGVKYVLRTDIMYRLDIDNTGEI